MHCQAVRPSAHATVMICVFRCHPRFICLCAVVTLAVDLFYRIFGTFGNGTRWLLLLLDPAVWQANAYPLR